MPQNRTARFLPALSPSVAHLMHKPERQLPDCLHYDWESMEKLLREADQHKRQTLGEVLDVVEWVLIETDAIDDVRLFVAKATKLADAGQARPAQKAPKTAAVDEIVNLLAKLQRCMTRAVGLLDLGQVAESRALLDACVVALDALDMRSPNQR